MECDHALGEEKGEVDLRFLLPVAAMGKEMPLTVAARLVHHESLCAEDGLQVHRHAVEFLGLGKGEKVLLQNFLYQLILEPKAPAD